MTDSVWIQEMFWPDIAAYLEAGGDTALVPIGATEQHGPHTALFVDTAWACDVAEAVARQTGALVAPPVHTGYSHHHLGYPGGITLRAETLTQLAMDIGESLVSHGFRRIIFVNGNRVANLPPLQIAITRLRYKTGAFTAIVDTHLVARKAVCAEVDGRRDASNHAGEVETSFMMAAHPEFVRTDKIPQLPSRPVPEFQGNFPMDPPFDADVGFVVATADEFRDKTGGIGVYSDPSLASAEKGRRILDVTIDNAVRFVRQVQTVQVDCEKCPIPV